MATYQKTKAYEGAEDAKVRPPALDAQCIGADGMMSHGYHEPDDGMPRGAAPRIDSGFTLGVSIGAPHPHHAHQPQRQEP